MPAGLEGPPWQDAETVESTAHVATDRRKGLEMTGIETAFSSSVTVELPFFLRTMLISIAFLLLYFWGDPKLKLFKC